MKIELGKQLGKDFNIIEDYKQVRAIPSMKYFDFGLMFFDDISTVYVSEDLAKKVKSGELAHIPYAMLTYRKSQKTIEEVVTEIEELVKSGLREQYEKGQIDINPFASRIRKDN